MKQNNLTEITSGSISKPVVPRPVHYNFSHQYGGMKWWHPNITTETVCGIHSGEAETGHPLNIGILRANY